MFLCLMKIFLLVFCHIDSFNKPHIIYAPLLQVSQDNFVHLRNEQSICLVLCHD